VHIHSKLQLIPVSGLPSREVEAKFKLKNLDYAHVTHGWRFCHNSMIFILIFFKPQKVYATLIAPTSNGFSNDSF